MKPEIATMVKMLNDKDKSFSDIISNIDIILRGGWKYKLYRRLKNAELVSINVTENPITTYIKYGKYNFSIEEANTFSFIRISVDGVEGFNRILLYSEHLPEKFRQKVRSANFMWKIEEDQFINVHITEKENRNIIARTVNYTAIIMTDNSGRVLSTFHYTTTVCKTLEKFRLQSIAIVGCIQEKGSDILIPVKSNHIKLSHDNVFVIQNKYHVQIIVNNDKTFNFVSDIDLIIDNSIKEYMIKIYKPYML